MKITAVEPIVLRLDDVAMRADGTQDAFLLRIETDEGITGIGEADTAPFAARTIVEMPASHANAWGMREALLGRDPLDIEPIWHDLYRKSWYYGRRSLAVHVLSAVDMALHDLVGKALGQPVHRLLGGRFRDRVRVYASMLMPFTPDEVRRVVTAACEAGYSAIKLGWGPLGSDANLDVALVRAARETCGPDRDLMIDAGGAWTPRRALDMAERFAEFELLFLEEPITADAVDGHGRLTARSPIPIAAGEEETTIFGFRDLVERGGLDVLQPDLARCGGFTQARRIAALTHERGCECVPHAFSSGVLVAASLHFVAAMPHGTLAEFSVADSPFVRDLLDAPFALVDGQLEVPTGPGLGIELDRTIIDRFRVA